MALGDKIFPQVWKTVLYNLALTGYEGAPQWFQKISRQDELLLQKLPADTFHASSFYMVASNKFFGAIFSPDFAVKCPDFAGGCAKNVGGKQLAQGAICLMEIL